MNEFDEECLNVFLENQSQLFEEAVAETLEDAEAFLEDCMAVVVGHLCLSLKDLAVNGSDLMALGFSGRAIGTCLNALLGEVLEQRLPNERQALLAFAEKSILARRTDKQII